MVLKRLSDTTYIHTYISRKTLRSLRPEIGEFAGRAGEDRAGQGDISKADRAKAEQGVGKKQGRALCNMNKQMCRAGPKRRARKKGPK